MYVCVCVCVCVCVYVCEYNDERMKRKERKVKGEMRRHSYTETKKGGMKEKEGKVSYQ